MKVILGKCKGGGVKIVYIYISIDCERSTIYIYTFFFKGTFNLQIFFILFYKSSKGKCFSFDYQGIIGYPTFHFFFLLVCLVCLSLLNLKKKRFFPLISVTPSFSLVFIFCFPFFLLFYILLFLFLLDFFFIWPYFPILPLLCFVSFFFIIYLFFPYSFQFVLMYFLLFFYPFLGFVRGIERIIVNKYMQAWN